MKPGWTPRRWMAHEKVSSIPEQVACSEEAAGKDGYKPHCGEILDTPCLSTDTFGDE